jgi:Pectate lyase superfamily protein/Major tropism determinant N-terminal domain
MAVVQISRIQIRRGQKNTGSGIPQLASGELAWAVDTQELFIGNGSVAEGSPYVGNSKILTTNDSILDLFEQYQYKKNDPTIQTGSDTNFPILRSIQERLDERVTVASFGAIGDLGSTDDTTSIQRAIDQLYLNTATVGLAQGRFILEFGPGVYTISNTIYLPSYTSIIGAGQGRTVINYTGTGSAFEFVNDTSTAGSYSSIGSTTFANQPKHLSLSGFSLNLSSANTTGFKLNAVRNSVFEDIGIAGQWELADAVEANSIGIAMFALSDIVTCQSNQFSRINFNNLSYGVYAKQDIINNVAIACAFHTMYMGVSFGQGANLTSTGERFGPRNNSVTESVFEDVRRQGIKVANGNGNLSSLNRFTNVGNDNASSALSPVYGQIEFDSIGNSSVQDIFDRADDLATSNSTTPYVGEVIGQTSFNNVLTRKVGIVQSGSFINLFRLPIANTIGYEIEYVYQSTSHARMRRGKLLLAIDRANSNVQIVDEYEYTGISGDTNLEFSATLVDSDTSGSVDSIQIKYRNSSTGDTATMSYTYKALS